MTEIVKQKSVARRFAPIGIIFSLLGVGLFAYFVRKAGVQEIYDDIRQLGWGFLLILAISGVRFAVRTAAWARCVEAPYRLPFWAAWRAYMTGDALGNLVPLGMVVSEPTKAALVRDRIPVATAAAAIAVENLFYSLSVALFIFTGAAWLLLSFPLPPVLRVASIATLVSVTCLLLFLLFVMRSEWRPLSGLLRFVAQLGFVARRNARHAKLAKWRDLVEAFERRLYGFYKQNQRRLLPILLLETTFHLAGVAEAYVTLLFISDTAPTLLTAFLIESVNRVINVVFKFVPLRIGVDEAGTGLLTNVLQLGTTVGVALAITRKARVLCWTGVGVLLLVRRGLSVRDAVSRASEVDELEKRLRTTAAESSVLNDEAVEKAGVR